MTSEFPTDDKWSGGFTDGKLGTLDAARTMRDPETVGQSQVHHAGAPDRLAEPRLTAGAGGRRLAGLTTRVAG
jgi:hypothetical protein